MFQRFKKWIPSREQIIEHRWLSRFSHKLKDKRLWRLERHAVAKGAAIGIFLAFMMPVAQILSAALAALMMRANITVAAVCTLITNPFTFAPFYWLSYQIGSFVLGKSSPTPMDVDKLSRTAELSIGNAGWMQGAIDWISNAGLPLITGLLVLGTFGACFAYGLVHLLWHIRKPLRKAFRK
jgi:uncharacterized protein (DUF2062 family)